MHIQIIVSRKDRTNTVKLSPQNTSKGKNKEHSEKLGQFDRTAFKQSGETLFDKFFDFERGLKDSLVYANTMKNGTAQQKAQMQILGDIPSGQANTNHIREDFAKGVASGLFESIGQMIGTIGKLGADLLSILMEPVYNAPQISPDQEAPKRRKKKKGQSQGYGRSM